MEELKKDCRRTVMMYGIIPIIGFVIIRLIQITNLFSSLILLTAYFCLISPAFYAILGNRFGFFDSAKDSLISFGLPMIDSGIACVLYIITELLFFADEPNTAFRVIGIIIMHFIVYSVIFLVCKGFMWDANIDDRFDGYYFDDDNNPQ